MAPESIETRLFRLRLGAADRQSLEGVRTGQLGGACLQAYEGLLLKVDAVEEQRDLVFVLVYLPFLSVHEEGAESEAVEFPVPELLREQFESGSVSKLFMCNSPQFPTCQGQAAIRLFLVLGDCSCPHVSVRLVLLP